MSEEGYSEGLCLWESEPLGEEAKAGFIEASFASLIMKKQTVIRSANLA